MQEVFSLQNKVVKTNCNLYLGFLCVWKQEAGSSSVCPSRKKNIYYQDSSEQSISCFWCNCLKLMQMFFSAKVRSDSHPSLNKLRSTRCTNNVQSFITLFVVTRVKFASITLTQKMRCSLVLVEETDEDLKELIISESGGKITEQM